MAEDEERHSGCSLMVLYNGIFRRRGATSPHAGHKIRRSSDEPVGGVRQTPPPGAAASAKVPRAAAPRPQSIPARYQNHHQHQQQQQRQQPQPPKSVPRSLSKELDSVIYDYQRVRGGSTLLRASSGNVMLHGQLGNLARGGGGEANAASARQGEEKKEEAPPPASPPPPPAMSMCRALSRRIDPEELKEMGNEEYRNGRFAEALALYDRAIAMDPKRAAYWSNKAAALTGLGKPLEAVGECKEALKIDPSYKRAHYRLGTLYLRLGEPEKALRHYKQSGNEATLKDSSKTQSVKIHLNKCNEARLSNDWETVLREAQEAISMGADFSPLAFAAQAEALMKLQRHEEAVEVLIDAPKFDIDESTKFFGPSSNAYFLTVRAQISLASGRFEDAVAEAQWASRIDPSSKDAATLARRTRAVASARSKGNDLFKAGRFAEACTAYGEGLDHDSRNSVLLCNRAACRMKLNQWERAIEDCNNAMRMRPSYHKARLRRAECNMKMKKWEEAQKDYETLSRDLPGDEEIQNGLLAVQSQLKKQSENNGNDINTEPETKTEPDVILIKTGEQFSHLVNSNGLSVALFCDEASESRQMIPFMAQLSRRYPSCNFLKVDKEDLAKLEGVNSLPAFRIYQNGSKAKEIDGADWGLLETSIKNLISLELVSL